MEMIKALGIDYGEARVGVACSDDLGMLAHPVETIEVRKVDVFKRIAEIAAERKADVVVIGMPYRLDGSRGTAAEKVEGFVRKVGKALPELKVETFDERLTTTSAQAKLHAAGRTVKNSRCVIDQAAAVEILQGWLDAQPGATL
jgi:putative Holliday junction resolvase